MLIPIEKIKINDRIRKDFGDVEELADDIMENGLINPPVINNDYVLLAGERRIMACKLLGWKQIPVNVMNTRDAEHELKIEINENDFRKGFSKAERAEIMKRLYAVEQKKAKERQGEKTSVENNAEVKRADEAAAVKFDISASTMRKEIQISERKDLFTPEEFAEWDDGKLSTNKAYQRLKARLEEAEQKLIDAEENPEVIEVFPDDYEQLKRTVKTFKADMNKKEKEYIKLANERNELQDRVKELEKATPEGLDAENLSQNVFYFCTMCNNFIGNVGGLVWLTDRIREMPDKEKDMFLKAAESFRDWSLVFTQNLEKGLNEQDGFFYGSGEGAKRLADLQTISNEI